MLIRSSPKGLELHYGRHLPHDPWYLALNRFILRSGQYLSVDVGKSVTVAKLPLNPSKFSVDGHGKGMSRNQVMERGGKAYDLRL